MTKNKPSWWMLVDAWLKDQIKLWGAKHCSKGKHDFVSGNIYVCERCKIRREIETVQVRDYTYRRWRITNEYSK